MIFKKYISILALFTFTFTFSQEIKLVGQVTIQNSEYNTGKIEYIDKAYVFAPYTKPAYSDGKNGGSFELEFVGQDSGTQIKINVEKDGLEVVNSYDLENVTIGMKSKLQIYLATKGSLAMAQMKLYNINKDALFNQKNKLIERLKKDDSERIKVFNMLSERFGIIVSNNIQAEKVIAEKFSEMEKKLPAIAKELVTKNLDVTSKLYLQAYQEFEKGNTEKTIQILNDDRLEKDYSNAKKIINDGKDLERIGIQMQHDAKAIILQTIDSYSLKAIALDLEFKFGESAKIYETIIKILKENQVDEQEILKWYIKAAEVYFEDGKYLQALNYQINNILLYEKRVAPNKPFLAILYRQVGSTYRQLNDNKQALYYQLKCIELQEQDTTLTDLDKSTAYNNISLTYADMANYEMALKYQSMVIEVREKTLSEYDINLGIAYNNISITYVDMSIYDKALEFQLKSMAINEKVLNAYDPDLAICYSNLADCYKHLGNYEKSLEYNKKCILINEKVLNSKHPALATSYNNISLIYHALKEYKIALDYQIKSINILEELGIDAINLARSYNNISLLYSDLNQYNSALESQEKAIKIFEKIRQPGHPDLAIAYNNESQLLSHLKRYDEAIIFQLKAVNIAEKALHSHSNLIKYYTNLTGLHYETGDFLEALKTLQKKINIQKNLNDNKNLIDSYSDAANVCSQLKQYSEAISFKRNSIEMQLKYEAPEFPDMAKSYIEFSNILKDAGDYSNAFKSELLVIKILEKNFTNTPELWSYYGTLGNTCMNLEDYDSAIQYYKKAIVMQEENIPESIDITNSYRNLALAFKLTNFFTLAYIYQKKAVEILKKISKSNDLNLINAEKELKIINIEIGKINADR